MRSRRSTRRGFSLVETMISLAIVAVALTGALAALISAGKSAREGQFRQFKNALADATAARFRLMDKTLLAGMVAGSPPSLLAPVGGWPVDTTPLLTTAGGPDISTGAYFTVDSQGVIAALPVPVGTPCDSGSIITAAKAACDVANGTACTAFCREVLVLSGLPGAQCGFAKGALDGQGKSVDCVYWAGTAGATATLAPGAVAYTLYVRVSRIPLVAAPGYLDPSTLTVQRSETFIQ